MADGDRPLPPNWRMARDSDGKAYYFNELTGETSWQFPSAPATMAPATDDMSDNMSPLPLSTGDVLEPQQGGVMASEMTMGTGNMVGVRGGGAGTGGRTLGDIFTAEGLPKLYLLLCASFVLLIQGWIHISQPSGEGNGSVAYAVAVGSISLGLTVLYLAYGRYKTDDFITKTVKVRGTTYSVPQMFAIFMTIWWTFGAFFLTFYAPYAVPSNAYLACWLGFVSSLLYAASVFTRVENAFRSFSEISLAPSLTALGGTIVAATVVFFVSLGYTGFWTGQFALWTSLIDFFIAAITYFCIDTKRFGANQSKAAAAVLVVMWSLSIFFLTFDLDVETATATVDAGSTITVYPNGTAVDVAGTPTTIKLHDDHMSAFTKGGNGFIATWVGMMCAFTFAYNEFVGLELDMKTKLRQSFALRSMETGAMQPTEVV